MVAARPPRAQCLLDVTVPTDTMGVLWLDGGVGGSPLLFGEFPMRPVTRKPVHKGSSVRKFKKGAGRTKRMNVRTQPMRGGLRI